MFAFMESHTESIWMEGMWAVFHMHMSHNLYIYRYRWLTDMICVSKGVRRSICMMLPYPNKIQDFWVFVACSLRQKLFLTALTCFSLLLFRPPTRKTSDYIPTFHDLDDRIIRVVTLLKKTRLETHKLLHQRCHASAETALLRPAGWRKRGGNPKNHGVTCKAVPVWDGKNDEFSGHVPEKIVILPWEIQGFLTCKSF